MHVHANFLCHSCYINDSKAIFNAVLTQERENCIENGFRVIDITRMAEKVLPHAISSKLFCSFTLIPDINVTDTGKLWGTQQ